MNIFWIQKILEGKLIKNFPFFVCLERGRDLDYNLFIKKAKESHYDNFNLHLIILILNSSPAAISLNLNWDLHFYDSRLKRRKILRLILPPPFICCFFGLLHVQNEKTIFRIHNAGRAFADYKQINKLATVASSHSPRHYCCYCHLAHFALLLYPTRQKFPAPSERGWKSRQRFEVILKLHANFPENCLDFLNFNI